MIVLIRGYRARASGYLLCCRLWRRWLSTITRMMAGSWCLGRCMTLQSLYRSTRAGLVGAGVSLDLYIAPMPQHVVCAGTRPYTQPQLQLLPSACCTAALAAHLTDALTPALSPQQPAPVPAARHGSLHCCTSSKLAAECDFCLSVPAAAAVSAKCTSESCPSWLQQRLCCSCGHQLAVPQCLTPL